MEQLAITDANDGSTRVSRPARKKRKKSPVPLAISDPVAEVIVDVNAAAVDHTFDYSVPESMSDSCLPGCRVRVRFAGRLVNAFVLTRRATTDHEGRLSPISKVTGPPVLTNEIASLARFVADRYAGTCNEVLRDAVPTRHAASETAFTGADGRLVYAGESAGRDSGGAGDSLLARYDGGAEVMNQLSSGLQVRASVVVSAVDSGPLIVGELVSAAEGGAVVVVPDGADVQRFADALSDRFPGSVARLTGDQPISERYGSFLQLLIGDRTIAVGTRNSVFAPVTNPALIVVWDDGDESLAEVRAPGWHAREVAALRSHHSRASLIIAGHCQSVEAARLVDQGWLQQVIPDRTLRRSGPHVITATSGRADDPAAHSRVPRFAWDVIARGLESGPVLVQVGRAGYVPGLACNECRTIARCAHCAGPLAQPHRGEVFVCRWCGQEAQSYRCPECGGSDVRAIRVGSERTADELRAAFPGVPVVVSDSNSGVKRGVSAQPQIVVATVGAEPVADDGYQAALLLDGDALLAGAHLRGEEQLVRRWFNAVSLVKGVDSGGEIAVTGDAQHRAIQALVRADPAGWAARELADRKATGLPPMTRSLAVTGTPGAVDEFIAACRLDPTWRVLGPTQVEGRRQSAAVVRVVVLAPTHDGRRMASGVKAALSEGAASVGKGRVVVRIDPVSVL